MIYRNEVKHILSASDRPLLLGTLRAVMRTDPYHEDTGGRYHIRSLYFDDPYDRALREKLDGVSEREKFRLRFYNGDTSMIRLEKKVKKGGLGCKISAAVTPEEAGSIVEGDLSWMKDSGRPLPTELYAKMRAGLRPRTIVDYDRTAFVYAPGNVRVTLDDHIRTGLRRTDFLNPDCPTIAAGQPVTVLEVKWDEYLPDCVRQAVQLRGRRETAFSKYQTCRMYD